MTKQASRITIRAVGDDASDVAALAMLKKAWNEEYWSGEDKFPSGVLVSAEQARRRLQAMRPSEEAFLAELNGEPIGFMCIRFSPYLDEDVPYAEVTQLYVLPDDQRRHGVATRLMSHAEKMAGRRGCTSVHLVTRLNNDEAQAFYRASGYDPLHVGFEKFFAQREADE